MACQRGARVPGRDAQRRPQALLCRPFGRGARAKVGACHQSHAPLRLWERRRARNSRRNGSPATCGLVVRSQAEGELRDEPVREVLKAGLGRLYCGLELNRRDMP